LIEAQLRICREQDKRKKWKIVGTYKHAKFSGAIMIRGRDFRRS
jgi:hypothetical protein